MTEITVFTKGKKTIGFNASGHCGYAAAGEDIVCAAVSAVMQTAVLGVTRIAGCQAAFEMKDGELYLMLDKSVKGKQLQQAELILRTMLLGLRSIQEEYSNYLKLIEKEV